MRTVMETRIGPEGREFARLCYRGARDGYGLSFHRDGERREARPRVFIDAGDDREAIVAAILELGLADGHEVSVVDRARPTPAGVLLLEWAPEEVRERITEWWLEQAS